MKIKCSHTLPGEVRWEEKVWWAQAAMLEIPHLIQENFHHEGGQTMEEEASEVVETIHPWKYSDPD